MSPPSAPMLPFGAGAVAALDEAGLDLARVAFARQVHGAGVAHARGPGFLGTADVIVTTAIGQPLAVFTADCLALVLHAPDRGALAVAHIGWRGTIKSATRAAVEALVATGASPARLRVAIAPSIGPCCYEVDRVVVDPLAAAFATAERWITPAGAGKWMLDLWAANEAQLAAAGVDPSNIHNARLCTACRRDLFYSYRKRDGGRLVTIAALPEPAGRSRR